MIPQGHALQDVHQVMGSMILSLTMIQTYVSRHASKRMLLLILRLEIVIVCCNVLKVLHNHLLIPQPNSACLDALPILVCLVRQLVSLVFQLVLIPILLILTPVDAKLPVLLENLS